MGTISDDDRKRMLEALEESRKSKPERGGRQQPPVGAVVVLSTGESARAHRGEIADGDHAEFTLLERKLRDKELQQATLYVTLEPCTTRGTHTPCAEHIISRGIRRVLIGSFDPDPRIYQKGLRRLIDAGIDATLVGGEVTNEVLASLRQWDEAQRAGSRRRNRKRTIVAVGVVSLLALFSWLTIYPRRNRTFSFVTPRSMFAVASLPDGRVRRKR